MPVLENKSARQIVLPVAVLLVVVLAGLVAWRIIEPKSSIEPDTPIEMPTDLSASGAVKITVDREGVYAISAADLRRMGIDPEQVTAADLRLIWRGRTLPGWIENGDPSVQYLFYAPAPSSPYSREDAYYLTWNENAPAWLYEPAPASEDAIQHILDERVALSIEHAQEGAPVFELKLEEQAVYFPQVESGDRFLWKTLAAPSAEDIHAVLEHLDTGATGEAALQIDVWASTEAPVEPDHAVIVLVNGEQVASETWDGRGRHSLVANFPASLLNNGENTIRIELPGVADVAAELVNLDRIVLHYPGRLNPEEKQQLFLGTGAAIELAPGLPHAVVYDISDPINPAPVDFQSAQTGGRAGIIAEAGRRYLALQPGGAYSPSSIELPNWETDLRDLGLEAEYIAIGPKDLLEALQPLMALREEQGITTLLVEDRLVYDQFGFGFPEPAAIQAFLKFARHEWSQLEPDLEPRFLLLVGDATYDPRRYLSTDQSNRLPTFLVDTVFGGQTATDVGFVQFNEDEWPDLAVGRLPAQTAQQVQVYVSKVLLYEQELVQNEAGFSVRAVADGQEASFALDAQEFLELFPDEVSTDLYSPSAGAENASDRVREIFHEGGSIVAYFGHGSVNMWGKDRLFTVEDVAALDAQTRFPVVLNLTCLTGLFTHPKVQSLAEALLWKADAGAIAVLAPSSLTLPFDQTFLSRPLAEAFMTEQVSSLGEMHLTARRQIPVESQGSLDVMRTFMLFGDPAIRIK